MSLWNNRKFNPMLLKEVNKIPNEKNYIYEIKFDGIRAIIFVNKNTLKIISRNNKDLSYLYPELSNIKKLFNKDTILDGEIIAMENNKISFEKLQERSHLKDKKKILKESLDNPCIFVAFDILYLQKDLIDLPLLKRKSILDKIKENDYLIKSKIYENGNKLFNYVKENSMEGIVAKVSDSPYLINTRSDYWLKIKNYKIEEFYIGGYEIKKGNYISVKVGEYKDNNFYYLGSVSLIKSNKLYDEVINTKKVNKSKFINYNENIIYIKPILKCTVKYIERTKNNQLRQPVIVRK